MSEQLIAESERQHWYAVHTYSRHEKSVSAQLERKTLEVYVPTYNSIRRWRNGRHLVQLPLFPGYAFVHIFPEKRLEVLTVPGVVRLVGFNGSPTPVADEEIEGLRRALAQGLHAEPHPYLTAGRKVRIKSGPLADHVGILVRRKGMSRVVLTVELIMKSVVADVDVADLEPC